MLNSSENDITESVLAPLTVDTTVFVAELCSYVTQDTITKIGERLTNNSICGDLELVWDSRSQSELPHRVFFAKHGHSFDPVSVIDELLSRGFLVVVDEDLLTNAARLDLRHADGLIVLCKRGSTEALLQGLCHRALAPKAHHILSIAITGTNGKTSTTSLVSQLLSLVSGSAAARIGTLGFYDGRTTLQQPFPTTPSFPILCQFINRLTQNGTKAFVMEASSHGLAERRLSDWKFDGAAISNFTPDHLDFHGTMEAYWSAKKLLFTSHLKPGAPAVIAAAKTPWQDLVPQLQKCGHPVFLVWDTDLGTDCLPNPEALIGVRLILVDHNLGPTGGINLRLRFSESSLSALLEMEPLIVEAPTLEGAFQVENLAIAMTLCHSLGYSWHSLVPLAKVLTPVPGRMENVTPPHLRSKAPNVFVDYAHTADALESALRSLRTLAHGKDILITTVFGCGGGRDRTKRPAMAAVAAAFSDRVIVTTDNSRYEDPAAIIAEVAAGFPQKTDWTSIVDRAVAIECAITSGAPGHFVLVAGKGHEDYQIIGETKLPFSDAATARRVLEKIFPAEDLEGGGA